MMNPKNFTERQKLIIKQGLLQYDYIMKNKTKPTNSDFKKVYTNFYLKSQPIVSQAVFFNFLSNLNKSWKIDKIDEYLYKNLVNNKGSKLKMHEFSFSSKLLHTVDDTKPIFDSKVEECLKNDYNVQFSWSSRFNKRNNSIYQIIKNDYQKLENWYNDRQKEIMNRNGLGYDLIIWFNKEFGKFISDNNIGQISNVKKIDFIIFAYKS